MIPASERRGALFRDIQRGFQGDMSRGHSFPQSHALHPFGGDKQRVRGLADLVNRNDVRVVQRRSRFGLHAKAGNAFGISSEGRGQYL
jgi:hypothetical protein